MEVVPVTPNTNALVKKGGLGGIVKNVLVQKATLGLTNRLQMERPIPWLNAAIRVCVTETQGNANASHASLEKHVNKVGAYFVC